MGYPQQTDGEAYCTWLKHILFALQGKIAADGGGEFRSGKQDREKGLDASHQTPVILLWPSVLPALNIL